ncbi:MAG: cation:proton antiporter [Paludibacter sp.]|nr:cation:proton antiporter [Paludibacter sp.]
MKHIKNTLLYVSIIGSFTLLMYFIVVQGSKLEFGKNILFNHHSTGNQWQIFIETFLENLKHPLALTLSQIVLIIFVARLFGLLFKKIGQPMVIGEIIAGILLGPSLLGALFPELYTSIFPVHSFENLKILSQIGLILFMFIVGMELDLTVLKSKAHDAIVISHASIIFPFALGMGLAYYIYGSFSPEGVKFSSFGLFMGISMSITAFPVLARIVQERGLNKTKLGTIVITCAAADDITAWCILASVIAIVKAGSFVSSIYTIIFALAYIVLMLKMVKPFLKKISDLYNSKENLSKSVLAVFFFVLLLSSFLTEVIGIHALFGAFMAGVIMPANISFRKIFIDKIEDLSTIVLLPLFFVYTGLRTEINLLNDLNLWKITGLIIVVAIIGKFVGSALTAKAIGQNWKESLSIGALMNTRGLMELVVINIGYELGVFSPEIFAMMVIMALVTTFMTTPALALINKIFPETKTDLEYKRQQAEGVFKVLIAVGNPNNGKNFLQVAKTVLDGAKNLLSVTVLHITPATDTNPIYGDEYAEQSFLGVTNEAAFMRIPIETAYKITDNIEQCIVRTVNYNSFDFLLVGAGISLSGIPFFKKSSIFGRIQWLNRIVNHITKTQAIFYPGALLKDKTRYFIENSRCSVGVFVNRGFTSITTTLILLHNENDDFLLRYARRLLRNNAGVSIFVMDVNKTMQTSDVMRKAVDDLKNMFPNSVKIIKSQKNNSSLISKFSFLLISYPAWNILSNSQNRELSNIPSTLIINKKASRFSSPHYNKSTQKEIDYSES